MKERPSVVPHLKIYQLRSLRDRISDLRWERVIKVAMNENLTPDEHVKLAERYNAYTKKLDQVRTVLDRKEEVLDAA